MKDLYVAKGFKLVRVNDRNADIICLREGQTAEERLLERANEEIKPGIISKEAQNQKELKAMQKEINNQKNNIPNVNMVRQLLKSTERIAGDQTSFEANLKTNFESGAIPAAKRK